jgi:hypothetical protein
VKIDAQVYKGRSVSMSGNNYSAMCKGDLVELGPLLAQFIPGGL